MEEGTVYLNNEAIISELTDKQKKTVEKIHRQLSRDSILSIGTDGTDDRLDRDQNKESISEEDADVLRQVIQAFRQFRQDDSYVVSGDEIDGRARYQRFASRESSSYLSYEYEEQSRSLQSRFVNPGRFYVRINEETKKIVKEVNDKIQREKSKHDKQVVKEQLLRVQQVDRYESLPDNANIRPSDMDPNSHGITRYQYLHVLSKNSLRPEDINIDIAGAYSRNVIRHGLEPFIYKPNRHIGKRNACDSNAIYDSNAICDQLTCRVVPDWELQFIPLRHLPPRERFRQAVKKVIRQRRHPRKNKKDYSKLWETRGSAGWLDVIFTLIGLGAFFADSGTDLKVAGDHFAAGDYWWGGFTLFLVVFPSVLVNLVSLFCYKEDEERVDRKPGSGWTIVTVTHLLQLGLIERYWRILVKGLHIMRHKVTGVHHYKLYIAMNLDAALLQMVLAFTEDAPQLVLQLYVFIRRRLLQKLEASSLRDLWTVASIFFSFISYSRAVVNYIKCLRDSKKHKGRLKWYGYIAMWFWRAFFIISRILVLVFFATEFRLYFFLVTFVHGAIIFAFIYYQEVGFFPGERWKQNFIRIVITYIQLFCFFVLEAGITIRWAVIYYSITLVEAIILSVLWYTNSTRHLPLEVDLAGLITIFVCFFAGVLMMIVYYKFLHPKFKRPQRHWYTQPPPKEELEISENEEGGDDEEQSENEGQKMEGEDRRKENKDRGDHIYKQFEVWV